MDTDIAELSPFEKNVVFSVALDNVRKMIEKTIEELIESNDGETLLDYEQIICEAILDFLEEFLPYKWMQTHEDEE